MITEKDINPALIRKLILSLGNFGRDKHKNTYGVSLARLTGASVQSVKNWAEGITRPQNKYIKKIIEIYKIQYKKSKINKFGTFGITFD